MTNQEINEIGYWLQNENLCRFIEDSQVLYIETDDQFHAVDCILSEWGINYKAKFDLSGNQWAFITLG